MEDEKKQRAYIKAAVYEWADVFTEEIGIESLVKLDRVEIKDGNIAGIDIPDFGEALFVEEEYDLAEMPLWVDYGIEQMKKVITLNAEMEILKKQEALIREELRITTQRVNLFEKVMIPRALENIRIIQIYLGDMQTAADVTGKIAKNKILKAEMAEVVSLMSDA